MYILLYMVKFRAKNLYQLKLFAHEKSLFADDCQESFLCWIKVINDTTACNYGALKVQIFLFIKKCIIKIKSYLSGSTVRSQSQLRASDAEILLLGSNASILSKRSNAGSGIKWLKSSRRRLRYCFLFCLMFWKCGRLITSGQLAGHGVPHSLDITKSWANSSLAY